MTSKKRLPVRPAALAACAVLLFLATGGPARAYQVSMVDPQYGPEIRWPTPAAGFYVNADGGPAGSLAAIRSAMQTWSAVPGSAFSFGYSGATGSKNNEGQDGTNTLFFGMFYEPEHVNTLALNRSWHYPATGYLVESDIKFNTDFDWATNGSPVAVDVETIALHELGHALSLDDLYSSADRDKVMYGYCSEGIIKRTLNQDDIDGIIHLYSDGTTTTSIDLPVVKCPAEYALGPGNPDLDLLRAFRDGVLAQSSLGRRMIRLYDDHAAAVTAALKRSPALRAAARRLAAAAAPLLRKAR